MRSFLRQDGRMHRGSRRWIALPVFLVALFSSSSGRVVENVWIDGQEVKHVKYPTVGGGVPGTGAFRLSEVGLRMEGVPSTLITDERIIQGDRVDDSGLFPELVMLARQTSTTSDELRALCTGTLVDEKVVLTAAHCTYTFNDTNDMASGEGPLFVCAGSTDYSKSMDHVCTRAVDGYVNDYRPGLFSGQDIALLGLESSLLVEGVQLGRVSFAEPQYGTLSYAAGFGLYRHNGAFAPKGKLRYVEGLLVPSDRCRAMQAGDSRSTHDPDLVCLDANYDGSGGHSCFGDSGGPLIVPGNTPEENYVVGVTAYSINPLFGVPCDPYYETVYSSLYSDSHREFLMAAMEKLGGSWIEVEDPRGSTCEGRKELCEMLPGDWSCLKEEDAALESCCPESISQIRCLKAVADDCGDDGLMSTADSMLEMYEYRCVPMYLCGDDDVERCAVEMNRTCDDNFLSGDSLRENTVDCCDAKVHAVACLETLAEKCIGSKIVSDALQDIDDTFAGAELCEEYECSQERIDNCTPSFMNFLPCDDYLTVSTPDKVYQAACCDMAHKRIDCLYSAEKKCPQKKLIRDALESAQAAVDGAQCFRDEADQSCDPAQCTQQFWTYCGEDPLELYDFYFEYLGYYPTGLLGDSDTQKNVFCCSRATHAKLCLSYQKERCGETHAELLQSEEERVEVAISNMDDCEATRCDPAQCDLIPFEEGISSDGTEDNGCSELIAEKICLENLLGKCEDEEGAISQRLNSTFEVALERECDPLDCVTRAMVCAGSTSEYSVCPPLSEIRPGRATRVECCRSAQWAMHCLQTISEEGCGEEPLVVGLLAEVAETYPKESCDEIVCSAAECESNIAAECEAVDASVELQEREMCCDEVNKARSCMKKSFLYECPVDAVDSRHAVLEKLESKHTDDECRAVSCERGIAECSAEMNKKCPGGLFGNHCCGPAGRAKDCLAFLRQTCESYLEVVVEIDAKIGRLERNVLEPHCDACYGMCSEGTNCVVTGNGEAFCANCSGLMKPRPDGTDANCCDYNADSMTCHTVLKTAKPGICRKSDDLYYMDEEGTRQMATGLMRNYACADVKAMRKMGIACMVMMNDEGLPECVP